ncbi:MAG: hypothetical protein M3067_14745 [Chloroflexota bacterium]|nr:hypothetical protein [Chloroflexota bacterium]
MTRTRLLAVALLLVALFAGSGLRSETHLYKVSPPLCGPYYDKDHRYAGDYGPCQPHGPVPPSETQWSWAPFWEPAPTPVGAEWR